MELKASFGKNEVKSRQPEPYRIWIIGSFDPQSNRYTTSVLPVSAHHPEESPADMQVNMHFQVHSDTMLRTIQVPINTLNSFSPRDVAQCIPSLQPLIEFRDILLRAENGSIDLTTLNSAICSFEQFTQMQTVLQTLSTQTSGPGEHKQHNSNQSVLDTLVDIDGSRPEGIHNTRSAAIDALIGSINSASRSPSLRPQQITATRVEIDKIISNALAPIMRDPNFCSAESSWLGLRLLLSELNGDDNKVAIELVNLNSQHGLDKQLETLLESTPVYALPSLILIDHMLTATGTEIDVADGLCRVAEANQIAIIIGLSHTFFPASSIDEFLDRNSLSNWLDGPRYDKWRSLRKKSRASWMVCAFNRFLMRDRYDVGSKRSCGYSDENLLWGNPIWALGALVVRSIRQSGWPTELYQPSINRLEGLPVTRHTLPNGQEFEIPTELLLSESLGNDLTDLGITPVYCSPNRDHVYALHLPTLSYTHRYHYKSSSAAAQAGGTLPYQLLISHITHQLVQHKGELLRKHHLSEIKENIEDFLLSVVESSGPEAKVDVHFSANPDDASELYAVISVRMGRKVLRGVEVELQLAV